MSDITCHVEEIAARGMDVEPRWRVRDEGPYITGLRTCSWCGSLHPIDLLGAVRDGRAANLHLADMKYGWPHKFYVNVPNLRSGEPTRLGGTHTGQRPLWDGDQVVTGFDARRAGNEHTLDEATDEQLFAAGWEIVTTTEIEVARGFFGEEERRRFSREGYHLPYVREAPETSMAKFYSTHLHDLGGDQFDEVTAMLRDHSRVDFQRDDKGLHWRRL